MKEQELKDYLKEKGLRLTHQRENIIKHFCDKNKHYTVEELYEEMKKEMPGIGFATVYRTLQLLVAAGFALERRFKDDVTRFEPLHKNDHHDHMICIECGRIIEFENKKLERLKDGVAKKHNFYILLHKLELYGYCEKCRNKKIKGKK